MSPTRLLILLLALAMMTTACRKAREAAAPPPMADAAIASVPIHPAPVAAPPPAWPNVFAGPGEIDDEAPRLVVGGLAMSRAEFRAGLDEYRRAKPDSANPEAEYETIARRQLLLLAWLKDRRETLGPGFEHSVRAELRAALAERALAQATDVRLNVAEADIRARYDRDIALYRQPARVSIEIILVSTAEQAATLKRQIESGANFAELARAQSQHSSSAAGGVLPPFSRGTYSTGLEDLAFALKPGEIGTVSSERGVFVVRKIADSPEGTTPYEAVRDTIADTIRGERLAEAQERFLDQLDGENR